MASKLGLLFLLCVVPVLVGAIRPPRTSFVLRGRVYCDTCRAGFETSATTYIPGAKVRVECKERKTMELHYSQEAMTDSSGTFTIHVHEDHVDHVCDAMLISSPQIGCRTPAPGRDRARVILTRYNGVADNNRYCNAMGFLKDEPLSGCDKILSQYEELDD